MKPENDTLESLRQARDTAQAEAGRLREALEKSLELLQTNLEYNRGKVSQTIREALSTTESAHDLEERKE